MFKFFKPTSFVRIPLPVKGHLYASPMPFGPYDPFNRLFKEYRKHRIQRVAMLVTDDEINRKAKRDVKAIYRRYGIVINHIPMQDFMAPTAERISEAIPHLVHALQREHVAVHCNAGVGRTGILIACLLTVITRCSGEEALARIRQVMQVNLTDEQQRFVISWSENNRNLPVPPGGTRSREQADSV